MSAHGRASLIVASLAALALSACLMLFACFGPAAVAPTANLAACVASDAFAGKSVADIAKDCGADVLSVLAALLASKDAIIQGSAAYGEAVRTKMALEHIDAGAP